MRIEREKGSLYVYDCDDRMSIQSLPAARWNGKRKAWQLPDTPALWVRLIRRWPDLAGRAPAEVWARQNARRLKKHRHGPAWMNGEKIYPWHTEPWPHQVPATVWAIEMDRALLHCGMGTGKTKMALDACTARGHRLVLIVCPKPVIDVWGYEMGVHCPAAYWQACELRMGSLVKRAEQLDLAMTTHCQRRDRGEDHRLAVIVNYESYWQKDLGRLVEKTCWDCVIFDESHRIKGHGSRQARHAAKLDAPHMIALTGTPLPHSPLDIFGQYRALDVAIFGNSWIRFRARYAVMGGYENKQVMGYTRQPELRRGIDHLRFEVLRSELTLPPLQIIDLKCDLEAAAKTLYHQIENDLIADVASGVVTVSNAACKVLRLQQIASGFLPPDDAADGAVEDVSTAKRDLLADRLEDLSGERVVVFCRFHADMDAIRAVAERQRRTVGEITGRGNQYQEWKAGDLDTLIVQLQAGIGIDLTEASYALFYSLGYSLGDYEQCLCRLHRPGQNRPVVVYRLLCRGTVDVRIARALANRKKVIEEVIGELVSGKETD